jgi:undecaprenyl-diphosphatase
MSRLSQIMAVLLVGMAVLAVSLGQSSAFIMGVFQGVTEFLPISSSAHLIVIPWLFAWKDPLLHSLTFDVGLHVGTLGAVLVYFWGDWMLLLRSVPGLLRTPHAPGSRLLVAVIIGTVPAAVVGVLFQDVVEAALRHPVQIALVLAVMGMVIAYADRIGKTERVLEEITWRDALAIGLAQACALVPGVSRSGSTMSAGRVLGYDRAAAARFAFLLSMPITLAAVLVKMDDLLTVPQNEQLTLVIGVITAAVVGMFVIDVLLRVIRRIGMMWFAYYRWVVAIIILVVWFVRG